jgi:hypothetical protein
MTRRLFFLAGFHAYVVFGLACLCGIIFRAGSLLIPTLLAGVRLFGSCRRSDAANTEQRKDNGSDGWHGDLPIGSSVKSPNGDLTPPGALACCSAFRARRLVDRGA